MSEPAIVQELRQHFHDIECEMFRDQWRVVVPATIVHAVLEYLKEKANYKLIVDITCIDYLYYEGAKDRFGVVYLLCNVDTNERVTVKTFVNDPDPELPTVTDLWAGADWLEREVWDMFGIRFRGHPDLRRILLPEGFESHPLRKDYPLQGMGERHNLPRIVRAEERLQTADETNASDETT